MKKSDIKAAAAILRRVNIAKVADKDIRKGLLNAFLPLAKEEKAFDEDMKTVQEKAFEGMDLNAHNELIGKIQKAKTAEEVSALEKQINPDIVDAIKSFNDLYAEKLSAESEVTIEKMDSAAFLDAMGEQETLTLAELEILNNTILK